MFAYLDSSEMVEGKRAKKSLFFQRWKTCNKNWFNWRVQEFRNISQNNSFPRVNVSHTIYINSWTFLFIHPTNQVGKDFGQKTLLSWKGKLVSRSLTLNIAWCWCLARWRGWYSNLEKSKIAKSEKERTLTNFEGGIVYLNNNWSNTKIILFNISWIQNYELFGKVKVWNYTQWV